MIYNCPNCMAALIYNPTKQKLDCLSCGCEFEPSQFDEQEKMRKQMFWKKRKN